MKSLWSLFSFGLLFSLSASAGPLTCPGTEEIFSQVHAEEDGILETSYGLIEELNLENISQTKCKNVHELADVIIAINNKLGEDFSTPKNMIVNLIPVDMNAYAMGNFMNVPLSLLVGSYRKHPIYTRNVWAHEYGHNLFMENMAKISPVWAEIDVMADKYVAQKIACVKLEKVYLALEEKYDDMDDDNPNIDIVEEQLGSAEDEFDNCTDVEDELYSDLENNYGDLNDVSTTYNELWADIIAVVYAESGSAIYDALFRTAIHQNPEYADHFGGNMRSRDFTYRHNRLDKWEEDNEPHGMLAPARYYLWENHLKRPTNLVIRPGAILKDIFEVIAEEVEYLTKNIEEMDEDPEPRELNQRLIDKFEKKLK